MTENERLRMYTTEVVSTLVVLLRERNKDLTADDIAAMHSEADRLLNEIEASGE